MATGEMAIGEMCCGVFRAVCLDPMPVIDDIIYIPGAEGVSLTEIMTAPPCLNHRFNFRSNVDVLLRARATTKKLCPCVQRAAGKSADKGTPQDDHVRMRRSLSRAGCGTASGGKGILWPLQISQVVAAYKWLLHNRGAYPKGCEAAVVYQIRKSSWLPPGLYVYRKKPSHFGCVVERPISVIEQFNLAATRAGSELPNAITVDMYPGSAIYSAMYVVTRRHTNLTPEYSNRLFGEVAAMGILDMSQQHPDVIAVSERHEVAMRTNIMYVCDMRWRAFDTLTACVAAIPKIAGMKAVIWSNCDVGNAQDVECKVLSWIFGHCNELPPEVTVIDHTARGLEVRYILMTMDAYPHDLPQPPRQDVSFFIHTYFSGDYNMALDAAGSVTGPRSRMCSPCGESPFTSWYALPAMGSCQPTPYTCGETHTQVDITAEMKNNLVGWTLAMGAADCQGLAVQHTLHYHCEHKQFQMMVCHTVRDADTSISVFRL